MNKDKGKNVVQIQEEEKDLRSHWNNVYSTNKEEKLDWNEIDLSPTLELISRTSLAASARILNVGSGSTTLIDELLNIGYHNIIATDLSEVALSNLEKRLGYGKIECVVDDLTKPTTLKNLEPVDLWIDRAVLHFITERIDQDTYFELLRSKVKKFGYVLLAEYNLNGAIRCAGLPVQRYSEEMLMDRLGPNFELIESFDYKFIMPAGDERPYIYTLFRKI